MKKEYKEELEQIHKLLDCPDNESRLLGLSMFNESKWMQDIKNSRDLEDFYIQDEYHNSPDEYCWLDNFLYECKVRDNTIENLRAASEAEDFIRCLLNGTSQIVEVVKIEEFSK